MEEKTVFTEEQEKQLVEWSKTMAKDGLTFRHMKGITAEEMEAVYSIGFNFYNTGRYDDAEQVFQFLVMFDHLTTKYWMGLAAVHQVRKNYDAAVSAYGFATVLDIHDPKPHYHAAECLFAKGDVEGAKNALLTLRTFAKNDTERGREYLEKADELESRIAQSEQ